jgi:hypothetical protein
MSRSEEVFAIEFFSEFPPYPFSYEPNTQQFLLGDESVGLKEFHEYYIEPREPISQEEAAALIRESPLAIQSSEELHMLPSLHKWLTSITLDSWRALQDETTEVLIDSYAELSGTAKHKLLKGSHWGFGTEFIRPGHPIFTVLGDCACYGVGLYGTFGQEAWDAGFASFDFHNIDWPAQKIALMAGAGAVATASKIASN